MIFERLKLIKQKFWLDSSDELKTIVRTSNIKKSDLKNIERSIKCNIDEQKSKLNKGKCLNWIALYIILDGNKAFEFLKSKRILKIETYKKNNFISSLIDGLIENKDKLEISENQLKFLTSKRNMAIVGNFVVDFQHKLSEEISKKNQSFIKSLLIYLNIKFYQREQGVYIDDVEGLSEAVSYLIDIYQKRKNVDQITLESVENISGDNFEWYIDRIEDAKIIKKIENYDFLIDCFDFICIKEASRFYITHNDDKLNKSIKYGYINSYIQNLNFFKSSAHDLYEENINKKRKIEELLIDCKNIIVFKNNPVPRFALDLSLLPVDSLKNIALSQNFISKREEMDVLWNLKENMTDLDSLLNFNTFNSLCLKDLLAVKRFFSLPMDIFYNDLYGKLKNPPTTDADIHYYKIVYNSWLPVFTKIQLKDLIAGLLGEQKAEDFLKFYCWTVKDNKKLDLQYTPFVSIGNVIYFSFNIFNGSNFLRNDIIKSKKRIRDVNSDFIADKIKSELEKHNLIVKSNIEFESQDFHGDFDVICEWGNYIFVFECKNIINPAGYYELRSSYVNLIKGISQLNKCEAALKNKEFRKYIKQKIGFDVSNDHIIVPCVVLATRMFNGYSHNGIHTRSFYELMNFIESGEVSLSNGKTAKMWEGKNLTAADLYGFIIERKLHTITYDFLKPKLESTKIKNVTVNFDSYVFCQENTINAFDDFL
jgi:hypothetical protein